MNSLINLINKKKNNIIIFTFIILILFSLSLGPKMYRNIKRNIYKESLSEDRQENYDKMKIEYINVKNRVTGTEPFNEGDISNENGVDVSPNDNYVRTFDSIKYTIEMGIVPNTDASDVTDASVFNGGVIKIKGKIPNQGDVPLMRFVEDAWMQNVKLTENDTEIYAEYHVPAGVSITNANQNLSFTINTDGYKKQITSDMLPIFEAWMEGNEPDGESKAKSVKTQDNTELIISGKVSLDARVSNNTNALYSANVDGKEGRYNTFALAIALYQPVSSFSDLRGIEYPSGPIKVDLDASYKAIDIKESGGEYKEITSTVDKSFGVLNGTNIKVHGYNGAIYDFYPESSRSKIDSYPAGKRGVGYSNAQSCLDGGNSNISISENKMTFTFDNYKIKYNTFPESTTYGKYRKTSTKEGYIISEVFQLFMPLYDYSETTSYDYIFSLNVNNIESKDTSGTTYKVENGNDTVKGNNSASINFSTRAQGNFYLAVGLTNGGNTNWRDGRANALVGQIVEPSFNFYAVDGPYDYSDRLISWDSNLVTLKKFDEEKWCNSVFTNGAEEGYITYKYGIYKDNQAGGVSDTNKLNSLSFNDFDWYNTAEEALANGKIAAIHAHDNNFGYRKYTSIRLKFLVNEISENIGKVAVFRQYCFAQSGEEAFKPFGTRTYRPTNYNEEGKVTLAHSPSEIGESLLILGVNTSVEVSVTDKDSSGSLKSAYDVQDGEIHIKNTPKLYTGSVESTTDRKIDSVLVTTTLPSGLSYHSGSSNKEPKSVIVNPDGSTDIIWEYNNWQINHEAPEYPEITFTADISASLGNNSALNIKSVIYTEEDIRDVEQHRTSNYGVIISNLAGSKALKSIDKQLTEVNESFTVTSMIGNTSDDNLTNIKTIEILPTNTNGSSFHGSYTIKVKKILENQKLYYTLNDINNIGITKDNYDKDTIKDVNLETDNRWIEVSTNDIIPSNATALASTINAVEAKSEKYFELEIIPTNNQARDNYNFSFNATSDNFRQAIKSNTVVSRVVDREISGLIFKDSNHNGIRENNEELIKKIKISLSKNNQIIDSLTTTDGTYKFSSLPSGEYKLIFDNIAENYGIIQKDVGSDDKIDSDGDYLNEKPTIAISLPAINKMNNYIYTSSNNDLGLEVSKIEIDKIDGDNIPLKGAKFTIKSGNKYIGASDNIYTELKENKQEFTTDENGKVIIENIPTGSYVVNETVSPKGYMLDNTNYPLEVKKENGKFITSKISVINDLNLKEVKLTVKHILKDDGSNIIEPNINSYKYNSDYETEKLSENYYKYKLVETDGNIKGKITSDTTVTYYYTIKDAVINIKYIDTNTNQEIAKSDKITAKYGQNYDADTYEQNATIKENYIRSYKSKTDNYKGIVKQDTIDITYYYQKKDSTAELDLKKSGTEKITSSSDKVSYKIIYSVKLKDYIGNAKIIIEDKLPYEIDQAKSNINGGNYKNNTITWEEDISANSYENDEIVITKNLELQYLNIDPTKDVIINNVSATIALEDKTIKISDKFNTHIDINGEIIVKYIDKNTNKEIADKIETIDKVGNKYSPTEKNIVGYNLLEGPENEEYPYKEDITELIYYYEKIKLNINTKVNGTGGIISGDEEVYYGDDSTKGKIKIIADNGFVIDKILINGKEFKINEGIKSLNLDNFINMSDNKLIEVSFKKAPEVIVNVENTSSNSTKIFIGFILTIISILIFIYYKTSIFEKIKK